ncbi:TrmH family RNA methyltransferase [Metabacillus sp. 84]|uniref:TrmH family RNA methyltransferase n=1 Tax=unclassified Metabacillus TaxID=2675274 RepID=UPI003CF4CD03
MKRIESAQNPRVKQWRKLHTRKERDKTGMFLIEGFHLVEEALKQKELVADIIAGENTVFPKSWNLDGMDIYLAADEVVRSLAETETTQGVFAVCRQPAANAEAGIWKRLLLLDAVQDPGNLGTMIRTADAAGMDAIILGDGTADAFNAKTIRSSQGSVFHLPIVKGNILNWIHECNKRSIPVYGSALEGAVSYKEISPKPDFAVIIGNEGKGMDPLHLEKTDQNLYIPIKGSAESLNAAVAAGILMYHLQG